MNIDSLLIAAEILAAREQGFDGEKPGPSNGFCDSPQSTSSSNDGISRKSPPSKSSTRRDRRPENNRLINREVHNRLEKNRRAQMRDGFEKLKDMVPDVYNSKLSNLALLKLVTAYVYQLRDEDETLQAKRKEEYTKKINLEQRYNLLKEKFHKEHGYHFIKDEKQKTKKNKVKEDSEGTSTASEGDEMEGSEAMEISPSEKEDNCHRVVLSDIEKEQLLVENTSRPTVVISGKDKLYNMASGNKKKPYILYPHLTSSSMISTTSTSATMSFSPLESANTDGTSSFFSSQSAAECLLQLNNFKNIVHLKEESAFNGHIPNKDNQRTSYRKQPLKRNSILDKEKREKYKPVRKKILGPEKKVLTADYQESRIKVLSSTECTTIKEPAATGVASSFEIENGKESTLPTEEKAKYIVSLGPCSLKNNSQIVPKMLLNTSGGKVRSSEQYLLVSSGQTNSAPSDSKPQVMVLENELQYISCTPVMKQEPPNKNLNTDLKVLKESKDYYMNSATAACNERVLIRDVKTVLKIDAKGTNDIKSGSNGSVPIVSDKNSSDIMFQVPASVMPSIGLMLSSMNNNRTLPEMKFCVAAQKVQQDTTVRKVLPSSEQMNNAVVDGDCLLKTNQPHNFAVQTNDSKLYVITVPNRNKTIHQNGKNV